jgi:hypothetical protein
MVNLFLQEKGNVQKKKKKKITHTLSHISLRNIIKVDTLN